LKINIGENGSIQLNGKSSIVDRFPLEYTGEFDWTGHFHLTASKVGWAMTGKLPQNLIGQAKTDGTVNIKCIDLESEFVKNQFVEKIVCIPFKNSPATKNRFLKNRLQLYSTMKSFKKEFIEKY